VFRRRRLQVQSGSRRRWLPASWRGSERLGYDLSRRRGGAILLYADARGRESEPVVVTSCMLGSFRSLRGNASRVHDALRSLKRSLSRNLPPCGPGDATRHARRVAGLPIRCLRRHRRSIRNNRCCFVRTVSPANFRCTSLPPISHSLALAAPRTSAALPFRRCGRSRATVSVPRLSGRVNTPCCCLAESGSLCAPRVVSRRPSTHRAATGRGRSVAVPAANAHPAYPWPHAVSRRLAPIPNLRARFGRGTIHHRTATPGRPSQTFPGFFSRGGSVKTHRPPTLLKCLPGTSTTTEYS